MCAISGACFQLSIKRRCRMVECLNSNSWNSIMGSSQECVRNWPLHLSRPKVHQFWEKGINGRINREKKKNEDVPLALSVILFLSAVFFPGIICAEGNLWRDQRRLSTEWLRKMGMTKFGPTRSTLEARILIGVNELLQVRNFSGVQLEFFPSLPEETSTRRTIMQSMNDADPRRRAVYRIPQLLTTFCDELTTWAQQFRTEVKVFQVQCNTITRKNK